MTAFSLHDYLSVLRAEGSPSDYIEALRRNAQPLVSRGLPVLLTLGHLAFVTDVDYRYLNAVVRRTVDPYRIFSIAKRSGGKRYIVVADRKLALVQSWIHRNILTSAAAMRSISSAVTAYVPGSSHIANASRHRNASWLIKVDVARFFESISERQVYYVFRQLGYRALMAFALTRLCTRVLETKDFRARKKGRWQKRTVSPDRPLGIGHLPQGAATSPMLANLVCRKLDSSLSEIADDRGLIYTRYADDITMSGEFQDRMDAESTIGLISGLLGGVGFGINHQKTSIAKDGGRKIVTGLSVDGDKLRVPRSYKDNLRQHLYYIEKFGLNEHCVRIGQAHHLAFLLRLAGQIRYVRSVEPPLGAEMLNRLRRAVPEFDAIDGLVSAAYDTDTDPSQGGG
ncbi:RNA-directed DNA polymerase [Agrobacterium sp. S2]|nr:RNA-directed DNA polymerase [Agrobacterium sp. S2]